MRVYPVALLLTAAALTACSSGEQQAAPPKPSSSAKPAPPGSTCSLLSASEVSAAIKIPGVTSKVGPNQENASNGGKATTCEYLVGDKQAGALAVTRYEGRQADPAAMVAAIKKAKPGAVDVPGFASGAVYYLDEQKTATLATAKIVKGVPVLVNYTGPVKMTQQMMIPLVKTAVTAV
ncbi:hypothetical protein VSH64_32170 [Amycolatopsis rhabdoformis]|uniref:DUF3558 domain-containing protein n=1 Tax=Amycolatopsis rhabdoformis TaxID=1448059 RepID=A0ABZ1HZC0_9PSEU|nr:hypothetical protein [Amycolatopsis rhabdoformis]WSE27495.1 hypothetical protein VSH64_32170 [Amycolatopsis rhabdoformis]